MGMSVGESKGGAIAEMNVVPLIDILLVLLIIFMSAKKPPKWAAACSKRNRAPSAAV